MGHTKQLQHVAAVTSVMFILVACVAPPTEPVSQVAANAERLHAWLIAGKRQWGSVLGDM